MGHPRSCPSGLLRVAAFEGAAWGGCLSPGPQRRGEYGYGDRDQPRRSDRLLNGNRLSPNTSTGRQCGHTRFRFSTNRGIASPHSAQFT